MSYSKKGKTQNPGTDPGRSPAKRGPWAIPSTDEQRSAAGESPKEFRPEYDHSNGPGHDRYNPSPDYSELDTRDKTLDDRLRTREANRQQIIAAHRAQGAAMDKGSPPARGRPYKGGPSDASLGAGRPGE